MERRGSSHFGTEPYLSRSSLVHLILIFRAKVEEIISKRFHICRYCFDISAKYLFYLFFRGNPDLVPTYIGDIKFYERTIRKYPFNCFLYIAILFYI